LADADASRQKELKIVVGQALISRNFSEYRFALLRDQLVTVVRI